VNFELISSCKLSDCGFRWQLNYLTTFVFDQKKQKTIFSCGFLRRWWEKQ